MAPPRLSCRTQASIWYDTDFIALSANAQRLYWLICTHPAGSKITGAIALNVAAWAGTARDSTAADVKAGLAELSSTGFIAVDVEADELWIVSRIDLFGQGPLIQPRGYAPDHPLHRPKLSRRLRLTIYERDGHQCLRCGSPEDLTLDHIAPLAGGGPSTEPNLQTLCRSCNSRKGVGN